MTTQDSADVTIEATLGRVAAVERDGFLVVTGPLKSVPINPDDPDLYEWGSAAWTKKPVPTSKPCPSLLAYEPRLRELIECTETCPACGGDGTVPIVVEVVAPERECPDHERSFLTNLCTTCGSNSEIGAIPARTLLRGSADAVPVVDDDLPDGLPEPWMRHLTTDDRNGVWLWLGPDIERGHVGSTGQYAWKRTNITDHFADVPRPEVGDTAWIIRGEGS